MIYDLEKRFALAILLVFLFCAPIELAAETQGSGLTEVCLSDLIGRATACLGTPYRWGGGKPGGFDCSGFVRFVFSPFGIDMEHSSASQARRGKRVSLNEAREGDLLFFRTHRWVDRVSHVGIYLGGGRFIHASSYGPLRNRLVKISNLGDAYYARTLVSIRRIVLPQPPTPLLVQDSVN